MEDGFKRVAPGPHLTGLPAFPQLLEEVERALLQVLLQDEDVALFLENDGGHLLPARRIILQESPQGLVKQEGIFLELQGQPQNVRFRLQGTGVRVVQREGAIPYDVLQNRSRGSIDILGFLVEASIGRKRLKPYSMLFFLQGEPFQKGAKSGNRRAGLQVPVDTGTILFDTYPERNDILQRIHIVFLGLLTLSIL